MLLRIKMFSEFNQYMHRKSEVTDRTILFLRHTGCGRSPLSEYEIELNGAIKWNPDIKVIGPLKKVFSKVVEYDFGVQYARYGVRKTSRDLIALVHQIHPEYVLWPTTLYEIQASTFHAIRNLGVKVIAWFFDDESRFDDYSKWWIPCVDYILTTDRKSVQKYRKLNAKAYNFLVTSNQDVFKKLNIEKTYDISFVGSKIADREEWIDYLRHQGIKAHAFGAGWDAGYLSNDEQVMVYNKSKINLCLVKSYDTNARPQMKDKIFDICMSGGFLLCEYLPGIEEYFEIDKEIVCFHDKKDAVKKIRYYLNNELKCSLIAEAGWSRAKRCYDQKDLLAEFFRKIENDVSSSELTDSRNSSLFSMPSAVSQIPAKYHFRWTLFLILTLSDRKRISEEIDMILFYKPKSVIAKVLRIAVNYRMMLEPIRFGIKILVKIRYKK